MAGKAGGILKGGGGSISGLPETEEIVTRSPLPMVRMGGSLASKKPQRTVAGPASMRGTSGDLCNEILRLKSAKARLVSLSKFHMGANEMAGLNPAMTIRMTEQPLHRLDDTLGHFLGVAEQHPGVVAVEQRVVDAGVARCQRALDEHHGAGLPDLEHRHAVNGRGLVVFRRRI